MGIIESVQQYDLNIPAGGAQAIDVAGDRVQFLSAVDPFAQIEIRPNFAQGNITLKPGQGFKFSQQVTRWIVFNRGSVALSGYLMIGSGDFFDQRISGDVNVIDGGKSRTLSNSAFAGAGWVGSDAVTAPIVQLWNPAGSGKRVVVEIMELQSAAAALTGSVGLVTAARAQQQVGVSKLGGGAAGVGVIGAAIAVYAGFNPMLRNITIQANSTMPIRFTEPLVLPPGYGVEARGNAVSAYLAANFEWYEEAI